MLRLFVIAGTFIFGSIISIHLTNLADAELLDKKRNWWVTPMLDESNYTEEGKKLRRRAMRFINAYLLIFLLYFVVASHVLSCAGDPGGAPPSSTLGG
jgi:hypothetical protein